MNADTDFEYLSLEQAAKILNVNAATLRAAIRAGKLTATNGLGYGYRTTRPWLRAFVSTTVVNPNASGDNSDGVA